MNAQQEQSLSTGDKQAHIQRVAQQLIDAYDEIDFDPHAVATELVERHGVTDLDEWLRTLPPGQSAYWSILTKHIFGDEL